MTFRAPPLQIVALLGLALLLGGCAALPTDHTVAAGTPTARALLAGPANRALEDRILALDPEHITDQQVRNLLAKGPTPQLMLLHGGVYPVHLLMESFSGFLLGMGYPADRIRDPGDGTWSRSPYESSERQAGSLAWYYERDGARPMVIGHSQGGIQAVKILHELAGTFGPALRVFNPVTGEAEARTTIVDPLTGRQRGVVGTSLAYGSVIGTGGWALALPVHWIVFPHVRTIPDSVDEFTGYRIGVDLFAWDVPGLEGIKTFHADGKADVRNVTLPAAYSHVFVPGTAHLAEDAATREWINAYDPSGATEGAPPPDQNADNILWAADVWHSIKKHWALEAQRFVRASQVARGKP
jgi:hypothetical protein